MEYLLISVTLRRRTYDRSYQYLLFKHIFGNPERKPLLIGLVNSILSPDPDKDIICDLMLVDREISPENVEDKGYRLDILGETPEGLKINIEVQNVNQANIDKRSLCYWSKIYGRQLKSGMPYRDLKPTYMINILNFNFFNKYEGYVNRFHITNMKTGDPLNDDLRLHFVEIPKWISLSIRARNRLERWITFLSNRNYEEIEEYAMYDNNIHRALEAEAQFLSNEAMMHAYEQREKTKRDWESEIIVARDEGIEVGMAKRDKEIARKMLAKNVPMETIQECTGLPMSEIRSLA